MPTCLLSCLLCGVVAVYVYGCDYVCVYANVNGNVYVYDCVNVYVVVCVYEPHFQNRNPFSDLYFLFWIFDFHF